MQGRTAPKAAIPPRSSRSSITPQSNSATSASESHGQATLKDLCAADKEKIGKMLQSVSTLNSENAALKESLKSAQLKHQDELAVLKQRGEQSMLDEADTRGKLSQALSLLAQYEERIQIVTRQMHAQESLLGETQSRVQQQAAELESCRSQLSNALQRPLQRSVMVQSAHNVVPVAIQTDRWLEPNSNVLPMPQEAPQPQSPPRSNYASQHTSPAKSAVADSVLLGSVRNSFTSDVGQPAAAPAPALLSLKHLNSLVSRLASSGIRPQAQASAVADSLGNDKWTRSSSSPWNSTSAPPPPPPPAHADTASPSLSIDVSSQAVSRTSVEHRPLSASYGRQSLDGYDVSLVDLVESIEQNRPKSSRLPSAAALRSSLRSSSARYLCRVSRMRDALVYSFPAQAASRALHQVQVAQLTRRRVRCTRVAAVSTSRAGVCTSRGRAEAPRGNAAGGGARVKQQTRSRIKYRISLRM